MYVCILIAILTAARIMVACVVSKCKARVRQAWCIPAMKSILRCALAREGGDIDMGIALHSGDTLDHVCLALGEQNQRQIKVEC